MSNLRTAVSAPRQQTATVRHTMSESDTVRRAEERVRRTFDTAACRPRRQQTSEGHDTTLGAPRESVAPQGMRAFEPSTRLSSHPRQQDGDGPTHQVGSFDTVRRAETRASNLRSTAVLHPRQQDGRGSRRQRCRGSDTGVRRAEERVRSDLRHRRRTAQQQGGERVRHERCQASTQARSRRGTRASDHSTPRVAPRDSKAARVEDTTMLKLRHTCVATRRTCVTRRSPGGVVGARRPAPARSGSVPRCRPPVARGTPPHQPARDAGAPSTFH